MVTFLTEDDNEGFECADPIDPILDLTPEKPATDLWGCFRVCIPQKTTPNAKRRPSKVHFDEHVGGDGGECEALSVKQPNLQSLVLLCYPTVFLPFAFFCCRHVFH
jgi:hypothetical protein